MSGGVLQLFPSRVAFVDPRTGILTPEGFRALQAVFQRIGGAVGDMGEDAYAPFIGTVESTGADILTQQPTPPAVIPESITQPQQPNEAIKVGQYIFRNDLLNPAIVYGYGTWAQIGGGFPAAYLAGDPDFGVMGFTGGARTITIADHATHTHDVTSNVTANPATVAAGVGSAVVDGITNNTVTSTVENPTPLTHVDGTSGLPDIDILPPYLVAAVWLRTA